MPETSYKHLAQRLDELPHGFPPTNSGIELRLLARLFTPAEAELAAQLSPRLENLAQLAERTGGAPTALRPVLKEMLRRGLIAGGRVEGGLGFGLLPFVVGIYEMQAGRIDAETAALFEEYYLQAFGKMLAAQPPVHRVIPVSESIPIGLEVQPFENAIEIINQARAWGVVDCICRTQKRLIGQPCSHPVDVCLTLSATPGAFDHSSLVRALTLKEAQATLHRAAEAGLVHSVSNYQEGLWYICNCCTCSCGILRGMADLGIANVVARSAYINTIDRERCILCGNCVEHCPFAALSLEEQLVIDEIRCTGCGVCTLACTEEALHLHPRPEASIPAQNDAEWRKIRSISRKQMENSV